MTGKGDAVESFAFVKSQINAIQKKQKALTHKEKTMLLCNRFHMVSKEFPSMEKYSLTCNSKLEVSLFAIKLSKSPTI